MNKEMSQDTEMDQDSELEDMLGSDKMDAVRAKLDAGSPIDIIDEETVDEEFSDDGVVDEDQVMDGYTPLGGDDLDLPISDQAAEKQYDIEADIPESQKHNFDENLAFHGRHTVNSNTQRSDNFRHLVTIYLTNLYDQIPTRRQEATLHKLITTSEFQMCRSNPERGGFDRKLQRTVLKQEKVDVHQTQTLNKKMKKKRRLFG